MKTSNTNNHKEKILHVKLILKNIIFDKEEPEDLKGLADSYTKRDTFV